ncbi:MAG: torS, partial [Phycisphaerales bacterium]|nr:torS [Phycisphaerales bacterium]
REKVVAPLVAERENESAIRCWVTACSSGEEAYSLAILLTEAAEAAGKSFDIKVFATDMAERTLTHARAGLYPGGIEAEVSPERLERFFDRDDALYRVKRELREMIVFAPQNILQDPPFSRIDVCSCRNLLIYLEPDVQQRVLALLHFGIREGGTLFLGTSETVAGVDDQFQTVDKKWRIFRRLGPTRHGRLDFPLPRPRPSPGGAPGAGANDRDPSWTARLPTARPSIPQVTNRVLLERFTPAAVVVDRDYRVIYYHGNTDPFLAQPPGEPTRELLALARDSVRGVTRNAVHQAATQGESVTVRDGLVNANDGSQRVWVTAAPLDPKAAAGYFLISFESRPEPPPQTTQTTQGPTEGTASIKAELLRVREELQSAVEELQTSNEELKASNEEVTSVNEELQSTNEELETSKEELQSMNEELTTVNAQLQAKMEEHEATSNDLGSLLASTDIAVVFLDTRFRIRRFTPAVRNLMDLIPSDLGRPLVDLNLKFTDPHLIDDARTVLAKLVPIERETWSDAGLCYVRRVLPYRTADNRIDGVVITFVDITDRKRSEQSQAEQARLLDQSSDAFIVRDTANRVIYWSQGATALLGWTAAEAAGRNLQDLLRAEGELPFDQLLAELRRKDRVVGEVTKHARDGRRVETLVRWSLDRDATGEPKAVLTALTDLSERNQLATALRASEEQFRMVVEGTRDFAIFLQDPSGRITSWNRAAEQTIGYTQAEAIRMPSAAIFTPEDREAGAPEQEIATAARTGRALDERWHLRKDGTRFWASGSLAALRGLGGEVEGYVKILRDETERKRSDEERAELLAREQAARHQAEAATRLKDEFLATLSHELRTPLSAILIWARMLQTKAVTPEQAKEGLEAIRNSAEAQRELIDDLLDTSRITAGQLRLDLRPTELGPVVRAAVDTILPTAEAKGVRVEVELGDGVGRVRADPDRLRQVVWNLLTNAVKFTPADGRVTVGVWRHGDEVEVRVADSGRGIPPDFLPHVFDRFRQADASTTRTVGGLGLGLAIVKQLVELHGGTVQAESSGEGKGSTFIVRLPLPRVKKSASASASASASGPVGLAGLRVLVVEDDPDSRRALQMLLGDAGAVVTLAETAATGFAAFKAARPDLLVSDIGLPGTDGYALVRRIRSAERKAKAAPVPAVALTAMARGEDRLKALSAGFQQHVVKPVDPEKFLAELTALLGR